MNLSVLGLSVTSSWGNGHATTFRGLLREFAKRGHQVHFYERDVPWYASHRDLPQPDFCVLSLYSSLDELRSMEPFRDADAVMIGSYVPEGVPIGEWALDESKCPMVFYDIDTPVTLSKLDRGDYEYLTPHLVSQYDIYFSFSGGPTLERLEREFGSPCARPLYCSFDPDLYFPDSAEVQWDLGYMGTYSDDRQPGLDHLLVHAAEQWPQGRFVVAGPQYPDSVRWPSNVEHIEHLPPDQHRNFYNGQRFALNITRQDMIRAGWSPSVRLFEAAACGTPIVSDYWSGLEDFFELGREILIAESAEDSLRFLQNLSEEERRNIGSRARNRVLREHTARHRAEELETHLLSALKRPSPARS